jgi:integrase
VAGDSGALLFPGHDGQPWTDTKMRNWRNRDFRPAVNRAWAGVGRTDLVGGRPYLLRHSYASLMLRGGMDPVRLARAMGHCPRVLWENYAHLIEEYEDQDAIDIEAEIAAARATNG